MKYKFITEEEVKTVREARKVIEKLAKKYGRLRETGRCMQFGEQEDHYRMYRELKSLKVDIGIEDCDYDEKIQLSIPSQEYLLEFKV